jgi:hypothetical protein
VFIVSFVIVYNVIYKYKYIYSIFIFLFFTFNHLTTKEKINMTDMKDFCEKKMCQSHHILTIGSSISSKYNKILNLFIIYF